MTGTDVSMTAAGSVINTVDVAVVCGPSLLLIRRAKPPFMDKLVLPGGHVEASDASLAAAAAREILEEVGLTIAPVELRPLMTLAAPGRDPRPGRRFSTVFTVDLPASAVAACRPDSDAREIVLRDLSSLTPEEIGFDHFLVVTALRDR
jgi:ADP-ribose pyrophosphatase YjhB (NUDIX family)